MKSLCFCSQLFCDFGEVFEVLDQNGETPESAIVQRITKVSHAFKSCCSCCKLCWLNDIHIFGIKSKCAQEVTKEWHKLGISVRIFKFEGCPLASF